MAVSLGFLALEEPTNLNMAVLSKVIFQCKFLGFSVCEIRFLASMDASTCNSSFFSSFFLFFPFGSCLKP